MSRNLHKRQKALLKKHRKAKERRRRSHGLSLLNSDPRHLIRQAREFPVMECLINDDWNDEENGLVRILLARKQPDGGILFGNYLVDIYCLGLKSTFCRADYSLNAYRNEIVEGTFLDDTAMDCPLDLAHQIIYQGIDYAAQFGFKPDKDFKSAKYVLDERGTWPETHDVTFGKDGMPFFVAGPYDNSRSIIARLEHTVGEGNFHYLVPALPLDLPIDFLLDDEEDED